MKLGMLEYELTFTNRETGEKTTTVSTPSMWALADEWCDRIRARGNHTVMWLNAKQGQAIWLQAAQVEGLMEGDTIDLMQISEMQNRYDVEVRGNEEDGADPTGNGLEGGRGTE